ncbi:MAG: tdcB, partial [Deltaproteobacteria bacterium]|nr:tdcB [Deltaproteobacteria bacterium]
AGYTFVHPYDDDEIIAGQGTLGAELIESMDRIDYVIVPVGGGGLISGIALMVKETLSSAKVIGVQTESATSAFASFKEGKVSSRTPLPTIADGIAVGRVGERPFEIITRYVDDIALVTEEPIAMSVVLFLERMKFVVEGAGAVGLAALLEHRERFLGKRVVIVVSGGNIDLTLIDRIIQKGLLTSGRMTVLEVVVDDVPGSLHALSGIIASHRGNIVNVTHDRLEPDVSIGRTRIIFTMETRGTAHFAEMLSEMKAKGFKPTVKHSTEDKG